MLISVVIPTHNRPNELRRAVKSIYLQTVLPEELIIVDDGSTLAVCEDIFVGSPMEINCVLLRNETPQGGNHARNLGIKHAASEWIMFLDDDDQFTTNKVELVSAEIKAAGEKIDVISHSATIDMPELGLSYMANTGYNEKTDLRRELLLRNIVGSTSFVTVKKISIVSAGLFWEKLQALQDNELWLRLALSGARFSYIDKPLTIYEQSINSKSITKSDVKYRESYKMLEDRYEQNFNDLSKKEKDRLRFYRLRSRLHRALLTKNYIVAVQSQLKIAALHPSIKNLLLVFLCLAGSRTVYKARSIIGKIN